MLAEDSFLSLFNLWLVDSRGHGRLIALGAKASDWVQWSVCGFLLYGSLEQLVRPQTHILSLHLRRCLGNVHLVSSQLKLRE